MIGIIIADHDFLENNISKRILKVNFTLTKPYNNNKIKIAFTRCIAQAFFASCKKKQTWHYQPLHVLGFVRSREIEEIVSRFSRARFSNY